LALSHLARYQDGRARAAQDLGDPSGGRIYYVCGNQLLASREAWCAGIKIVGRDGANKGAVHLLIYRFVPETLLPSVPFLGWLWSLADILPPATNTRLT
jgi:hypothetical protein